MMKPSNRKRVTRARGAGWQLAGVTLAALLLGACGEQGSQTEPAGAGPQVAAPADATVDAQQSAGKPSAPVDIEYSIIGSAIVGQPVSINVEVSSRLPDRPITLNYRINDARNLSFPQAQPQRVALAAPGDMEPRLQQVTVVPQREGRLYLNVTAEVETPDGMLLKSMAIPIQVGEAPRQLETNGEVEERGGERVNSLPAEETTR